MDAAAGAAGGAATGAATGAAAGAATNAAAAAGAAGAGQAQGDGFVIQGAPGSATGRRADMGRPGRSREENRWWKLKNLVIVSQASSTST